MEQRIDYKKGAPAAMSAILGLEQYARQNGIEPSLLELVRLRASQINGCAYCVDMHTEDARANGESEQRLYAVAVWRETPFFSERERAAIEWTETLTLLAQKGVSDEVYQSVRPHFDEKELVDLTLAIIAINGWNRLAVSFGVVPGMYQPTRRFEESGTSVRQTASGGRS